MTLCHTMYLWILTLLRLEICFYAYFQERYSITLPKQCSLWISTWFHQGKAVTHTYKSTAEFVWKRIRNATRIEWIPFKSIPSKFHNVFLMYYCAFRALQQVLRKRYLERLDRLWKVVVEQRKKIKLNIFKKDPSS